MQSLGVFSILCYELSIPRHGRVFRLSGFHTGQHPFSLRTMSLDVHAVTLSLVREYLARSRDMKGALAELDKARPPA